MAKKNVVVPNRSELKVPKGSERTIANSAYDLHREAQAQVAMGRPPVLNDEQLDALAIELNQRLGRPPKLEELIVASGGCQRQRASRAILRAREVLAARAVQSLIILPPSLETEMRSWIDRLFSAAASQLASEHARMISEHDDKEMASAELAEEQQVVIGDLRERLANQSRISTEIVAEIQLLKAECAKLKSERDIANAVADDRLKLLNRLKTNAAET